MSPSGKKEIRDRVKRIFDNSDVELIDVREESGRNLVFYLYKKGGIDLDCLEFYSKKIEKLLDDETDIRNSYNLVVSSPDWSRGIKTDEDLRRNFGEVLEFRLRVPENGEYLIVGKLIGYDSECISVERDVKMSILRENIKKIKSYFEI